MQLICHSKKSMKSKQARNDMNPIQSSQDLGFLSESSIEADEKPEPLLAKRARKKKEDRTK